VIKAGLAIKKTTARFHRMHHYSGHKNINSRVTKELNRVA
jgi:hypothetical protein